VAILWQDEAAGQAFAASYWAGSVAIAQGHRPVGPGWLAGRGVWLLPAVGRRLGVSAGPALAVSVIVTILARGPLGPFSLTDPWPLILLAASLVLVDRGRWWPHLVAGAFVGVALNLRPASYVSVASILLLLMVRLRRKAVPVLVGLALALVPQVALNIKLGGGPSPFPMQGSLVQDVQLRYWAYVPLYATSREGADPRVFYRDRRWPSTRDSTAPTSHGDLLRFYVSHPVDSVWLGLQKVSGWWMWTEGMPYLRAGPSPVWSPDSLLAAVLAAGGLMLVLTRKVGRTVASGRPAGFLGGTLLTAIASVPKTRMALRRGTLVVTAVVAVGLMVSGSEVVQHAAEPGPVTPTSCAAS